MKIPVSALLQEKEATLRWVPPTVTVHEAVTMMNLQKIGCILILDGDKLVGIFTERDVLTRVVGSGLDPRTTPISQVMTANPRTVAPDTPLEDAMAIISEKRVRHLPLVTDNRVVGLVSIGDINKWLVRHLEFEAETLRNYVSGGYAG